MEVKKMGEEREIDIFVTNKCNSNCIMCPMSEGSRRKNNPEHIEELKKEIDNLLEIASKGGESAEIVHKKIETKQKEINEIELDLFLTTRITDNLHINYSIPINYGRFTDDQKKLICSLLINEIRLHENGDMDIDWKC